MDLADDTAIRDRLEILELFSRYCFAIDDRDADGVAGCFTSDALFTSNLVAIGTIRGRAAIRELVLKKRERPPDSRRHMMLNPLIALDGDRATFRTYLLATWIRE